MKFGKLNEGRRKFWSLGALSLASLGMASVTKSASASNAAANSSLEERLAALEHEQTRLKDINEIANLQGRYEAIHNADESLSLAFFAKRPDTSKEITRDKIIGYDAIKEDYKRMAGGMGPMPGGAAGGPPSGMTGGAPPNAAHEVIKAIHPLGTPVIVVADDGQTAKATFTSLGFEGNNWSYGKYANSYIKIDGQWYLWHMKWLRCFKTPYGKAWYDQTEDEVYEFAPKKDEQGKRILPEGINYNLLAAPGKEIKTITAPKPYKTWTKEDEDGGWWKRKTVEP